MMRRLSLLGFDVELETGDWPRSGRGREGQLWSLFVGFGGEERVADVESVERRLIYETPHPQKGGKRTRTADATEAT